ncbi:uncharacterized protein LOC129959882 [Argiope bruennichi]|uniref:uncharacterized protein LOC129959882 n=1 Tax=Argiope bruennichi TaxID=94029 RepID=UPI0024955CEE|nr:uncharacterized protein LOC129959882 [Argiope bruennichi]
METSDVILMFWTRSKFVKIFNLLEKDLGSTSWSIMELMLSDVNDSSNPIHILIGADIMGKLLTGHRRELSSSLFTLESKLGWKVMGKIASENQKEEHLALSVIFLFVKDADISDLWKLDSTGIKDPIERKSRAQKDLETKRYFLETVESKDGRYEVSLPWSDDKAPLPDNFPLAKERLEKVTLKLISRGLYKIYEKVFQDWLSDGMIEIVPEDKEKLPGHYLPHHLVLKESSTTPIRQVFDASARMKKQPPLNQCLETGPNLIEVITDILLSFRERRIGITADI